MKTSIDIASIVYQIIQNSDVNTITGGNIFIGERPFDSKTNDIVVHTLILDNEQLRFGNVNVQVYAQNLYQDGSYYPNMKLLNDAVKHLKPLLKDLYLSEENIYIDIETERYYKVENAQEWVCVIKLQTRNIN